MRYPHADRSRPLQRHSKPCHGSAAVALVLLLALVIAGCAPAPPAPQHRDPAPAPEPVEVEPDPPEPAPQPAASPPAPSRHVCAWSRTKGLAEVVGLKDNEAEFHFYPGDIRVPVPAGKVYERGREFKAILMQAQNCTTRLELVDPVP